MDSRRDSRKKMQRSAPMPIVHLVRSDCDAGIWQKLTSPSKARLAAVGTVLWEMLSVATAVLILASQLSSRARRLDCSTTMFNLIDTSLC